MNLKLRALYFFIGKLIAICFPKNRANVFVNDQNPETGPVFMQMIKILE